MNWEHALMIAAMYHAVGCDRQQQCVFAMLWMAATIFWIVFERW